MFNDEITTFLNPKWRAPPIAEHFSNSDAQHQFDKNIIRWTTIKNSDDSDTIITESYSDDVYNDLSGWSLFINKENKIEKIGAVSAHGFAFSRHEHNGVRDLFFCTKGRISHAWEWNGKSWK